MKRFILFLLFFLSFVFGDILSPRDAFKVNITSDSNWIKVDFDIAKDVYVYKNKINFKIDNNDINNFIDFPKASKHGENDVYLGMTSIFIPKGIAFGYGKDELKFEISFQGCAQDGFCYQPILEIFDLNLKTNQITKAKQTEENFAKSKEDKIASSFEDENIFLVLLSFFGYGVLLSLTPCIFPMIPILASIIVAKAGSKPSAKSGFFISLVYVLSMSFTYAVAGVLAALFGSSVQGFLQIPSVIIISALIFVALALANFGFFEFQVPAKFQGLIDQKAKSSKGLLGVVLMGVLGALVVGPCVAAPLAGALLYIAQSGDIILGGLALFIMSLGMGVLLLLVGVSSKILPKPGFWMDEVRKIFGFLMLAMAVWLLGRILDEDVVLLLYGILLIYASVYFGAFDEAKTGALKFIKASGILFFIFGLVLILNFSFSKFDFKFSSNYKLSSFAKNNLDFEDVSSLEELNNKIINSSKPIMLDFTASWCENCKVFQKDVLQDEEVKNKLNNFKLLKVDLSDNSKNKREIMKEFNIFGPPAIIFFQKGNLKYNNKVVGIINKENFINMLENEIN